MSAAELSRFDELVSCYLDAALADTDATELLALLSEPTLAARFLETTRLNSEMAGLLAAPVPDAAMVELVRADIEKALAATQPPSGVRLRIVERTQPLAATEPTILPQHSMTPRRKFAWRSLAWAAVFLVFAGLTAIFLFNSTRRVEAPAIASVQGEVRLLGPKGERVLRSGQSWPRGETLKTVGANSTATVTFRDGSRLDFSGNSVVVNRSTQEGCRVELEHGDVRGALKQQPVGHPFVFATPEAEAIVVGTALRLVTGAHHTRLEVTEGEVRFRRLHDGAQVTVKTGYCAVVAPNAPLVATPFHPDPHAVH